MEGSTMADDTVEIDGHRVPAAKADLFYHADGSGRRLTDAEWDETQARTTELEALGDDAVTWAPIEDYEADA
jgi:hypothetical protein